MSEIKVNKISPRTNCGTTTLGDSGDTFTIPAGVTITNNGTQTGFGREGSVNWQTGSIKTSTFTATNGEGYFINSGSPITMNLPAGSAGAIVAIADYARNFATHNFTISPNGSEKIGGEADDAILNIDGQAATFVYVDSTKGWINVQNAEDTETGVSPFVTATGGNTIITSGDFKTHIFTGPGTFCVSAAGLPSGSTTVEYLVVGGGAAGGAGSGSGGGGAGGYRQNYPSPTTAGLPVSVQGYPISVGSGGAADTSSPYQPASDGSGNPALFSTITSAGGGGGGSENPASSTRRGAAGGSGGGGAYTSNSPGGDGNTPPVSPPQGNTGGTGGGSYGGGGGGGAGAVGANVTGSDAGPGGIGGPLADAFFGPTAPSYGTPGPAGSTRYFAGGGGGGGQNPFNNAGTGGSGGGGAGGYTPSGGTVGTANTGGGGGGGGGAANGANGGSGFVAIRYKFQ